MQTNLWNRYVDHEQVQYEHVHAKWKFMQWLLGYPSFLKKVSNLAKLCSIRQKLRID
jgi:hypothetical protein